MFGLQPYLAIKTRSGRYICSNFDFGLDGKSWHYSFDVDTVHSDDVIKIGVASNNKYGDTFIRKFWMLITNSKPVFTGQVRSGGTLLTRIFDKSDNLKVAYDTIHYMRFAFGNYHPFRKKL